MKRLVLVVTLVALLFALNVAGMHNDDDNDDDDDPQCVVNLDCYNNMHLCDAAVCTNGNCVYTPIDCSDSDDCTYNERCNPNSGECEADMEPECTACNDCCVNNPIFNEQILIANRGDRTTTSVYVGSETVHKTISHETNAEPLYINAPGCCGYDLGLGESEFYIVGDRLNSVVRFVDARTQQEFVQVPTCSGVFHMYYHLVPNQLWVVCDLTKQMSVISLDTYSVINQNLAIPADLLATYTPHDVTVGSTFAIVSLHGSTNSRLIKLIFFPVFTFFLKKNNNN